MGSQQAWILLNLDDFKYKSIDVIDKYEKGISNKDIKGKAMINSLKSLIKMIDQNKPKKISSPVKKVVQESDSLMNGLANEVGNFVLNPDELLMDSEYNPKVDLEGEFDKEFSI